MRGLRGSSGGQAGAFVSFAGAGVRQENCFDGGRTWSGRKAASFAGCVCGFGGGAVRVLHAGNFGNSKSIVGSEAESFAGRDSRSVVWEFVPVHRVSADF